MACSVCSLFVLTDVTDVGQDFYGIMPVSDLAYMINLLLAVQ